MIIGFTPVVSTMGFFINHHPQLDRTGKIFRGKS